MRLFLKGVFIAFGHFVASAMIAKGTDVKTVADILGHSNPNTTLSVYTHAFNEVKAKATDEIVDMLHLNDKFVNRKTS